MFFKYKTSFPSFVDGYAVPAQFRRDIPKAHLFYLSENPVFIVIPILHAAQE